MKTVYAIVLSLMIAGTHALASGGSNEVAGLSLLNMFFIALGVSIIIFQFIPGIFHFVGLLKELFSAAEMKSVYAKRLLPSSKTGQSEDRMI